MTVYGDRIVVIPPSDTPPQSPAGIIIIISTVLLLISPRRHPFKCLFDEKALVVPSVYAKLM